MQAIDRVCFSDANRTDVVGELDRAYAWVWVARCSGAPAPSGALGYILTWLVADELHVLNVATHPDFRRYGVGRALMHRALAFARNRSVRLLLLEVRRSNQPAIRLYRELGFHVTGVRRSYYADNQEDAVEMMLVLDPETGDIVPGRDQARLEEV
ncbi:MAG: ribosomal protein S18-alanine N-acetyltransferase [Polyangiaceae bacterium]|nr:ribosomal protein S18-alanine N-acetyltransferase [Polyangiaceae bacterium]